MRVWLSWVIWVGLGLGCTETELTPFPQSPEESEGQDMDLVDEGLDSPDEGAPTSVIGIACEEDTTICGASGFCLDGPYVEMLGVDPDSLLIPGGMCSKFCTQDSECGEGARCFNTQPFSGVPIKACLATCEILVDCRWREGYGCLDPSSADPEDEGGPVCMPDDFIYEVYCAADADRCEPVMGGSDE
jgi:Cys-rich repeat protein